MGAFFLDEREVYSHTSEKVPQVSQTPGNVYAVVPLGEITFGDLPTVRWNTFAKDLLRIMLTIAVLCCVLVGVSLYTLEDENSRRFCLLFIEEIPMDTMSELRQKALVFRLVLETSLYMMKDSNKKLNLERIGSEYNKLKKSSEISTRNHALKEKRKLCLMLCKLYEFSKKYHHGADNGSTLCLSALNPEEMHQYDEEIYKIHDWIAAHPKATA